MTGDYLPFTSLDKATATFRGFDVDMAQALGKALGVRIEFVPTAWPQMMRDFEADDFDIAMGGVSITLDRQKKGMFSNPVMREGKTPIARCADNGKYDTIADIDRPRHARDRQSRRHQRTLRPRPTSRTPRSRSTTTMSRSSTRSPRATPT